ncbi:MAG: dienelactone hydrolase family protein [Phycisphaerae bacterium]
MQTSLRTAIGWAVLAAGLSAATATAELKTRTVEYTDGETVLEGYIAWDDDADGERPGVLVVHEWYGLNDYARARTRQLAQMGYVAFAADIYGKGRRAKNAKEAAKLSGEFKKNPKRLRRRTKLALDQLKELDQCDEDKVAAIGYCFGGTAVLELARSGAELQAVVSFHGGLSTSQPADKGDLEAQVLVLHGGADPHVPDEELLAFMKEMRKADATWQVNIYGDAVHSFTNSDSGDDPSTGAAYNKQADKRSWAAMKLLFTQTIGLPEKADKPLTEIVKDFAVEKVASPVKEAGVKTGKAVKGAADWAKDKVD